MTGTWVAARDDPESALFKARISEEAREKRRTQTFVCGPKQKKRENDAAAAAWYAARSPPTPRRAPRRAP